YFGAQGNIVLNWAADTTAPVNDNFAAATAINGSSALVYGDNCNATPQAGEPDSQGRTVWWRWTAPTNGCYSFDTFSSRFDTILEVFTGTTLTNLSRLAYDDNAYETWQSTVSFRANTGAVYYIRVDGFAGDQGDIQLYWSPNTAAPLNDNFASAA